MPKFEGRKKPELSKTRGDATGSIRFSEFFRQSDFGIRGLIFDLNGSA